MLFFNLFITVFATSAQIHCHCELQLPDFALRQAYHPRLPYAADSAAGAGTSGRRAATSSRETVVPSTTSSRVFGVHLTVPLGFSITTFRHYGIPSTLCHLISTPKSSNLSYYPSSGNHSVVVSIHVTHLRTLRPFGLEEQGSARCSRGGYSAVFITQWKNKVACLILYERALN